MNPNNIESQNGWYQVGVIANSYGGNPGHANAKLAWIKGDFCKVVDVDMNAKPSQIAFHVTSVMMRNVKKKLKARWLQ